MGKSTLWCFNSQNDVTYSDTNQEIQRSELIRIIDHAVNASRIQEVSPTLANELRNVARTNNEIASHTFKVRYSGEENDKECGCPMTEAGVVFFTEEREKIINFTLPSELRSIKDAANEFVSIYDRMMPGGSETRYTVV